MGLEIIKKNFDYYREKQGIKIDDFAAMIGIKRQSLYSYFKKNVTVENLARVANALNVEPWQLLKPIEDEMKPNSPVIACPHCGKLIYLNPATKPDHQNEKHINCLPFQAVCK